MANVSAYFTCEYLYLMTCRDKSPRSAVPETTPWALQAKPMCLAEPSSSGLLNLLSPLPKLAARDTSLLRRVQTPSSASKHQSNRNMYSDEKRHLPSSSRPASPPMRRITRALLALAALLAVGCFTLWRWEPATLRRGVEDIAAIRRPGQDEKKLVPLEAHIMSKCPDAKV